MDLWRACRRSICGKRWRPLAYFPSAASGTYPYVGRRVRHESADAIATLVDRARAPGPGVVTGLTLRPG